MIVCVCVFKSCGYHMLKIITINMPATSLRSRRLHGDLCRAQVRIGDGVIPMTEAWYDAADVLGMLMYAGPYGNPRCPGCRVNPAVDPPPPGSEDVLVATYVDRDCVLFVSCYLLHMPACIHVQVRPSALVCMSVPC